MSTTAFLDKLLENVYHSYTPVISKKVQTYVQHAILANSSNLRQTVLKLQLQRALFDHDSKRMKFNMVSLKLLISLVTKLSSAKWKKIVGEIMGEQDELGNSDSCADADEDE